MSKNNYAGLACLMMSTVFLSGCSKPEPNSKTPPTIVNAIDEGCVANKFDYLRLDVETFEQDKQKGWRSVADKEGCLLSAAALMNEYRTVILEQQVDGLRWHEAQLRAAAGKTEQAIYLFSQTRKSDGPTSSNALSRDATIAFLKHDHKALLSARDALAKVPKPEGYERGVEQFRKKYPDAPVPVWPLSLNVVDGFITCFDKPYKDAYNFECRPK